MAPGETAGPSTAVGMTILLQGKQLFRRICSGLYKIVIPIKRLA
jgi:hypothetical protein